MTSRPTSSSGAARDEMVERFLPLSRQLARRYRGAEDVDDLDQIAAVGLLKAVDRFDPERGVAFSTFAVPTILGELKRHLRDRGWAVHVPRAVQELSVRVERVSTDLVGELGRSPTVAELSVRADAPPERVLEALHASVTRFSLSLDQPRANGDDDPLGREIATIEPGFAAVEDAEQLGGLMRSLSERDRRIIDLRFREDRRQTQIAAIVGLSQMQVSRRIRYSIERLQRAAEMSEAA